MLPWWERIFGDMLTGSMLIEEAASIPGIGKLAVDAMSNRDLPLLEGTVMYIAFVFVICESAGRYFLCIPWIQEFDMGKEQRK